MKKILIIAASIITAFIFSLHPAFSKNASVDDFINIENYTNSITNKIENNLQNRDFKAENISGDLKAVIKIFYTDDGEYNSIGILKSSGDKLFDIYASKAVSDSIDRNDEMLQYINEFLISSNKKVIRVSDGLTKEDYENSTVEIIKKIKENYTPSYITDLKNENKDIYETKVIVKLKLDENGNILQKEIVKNDETKLLKGINDFLDKTQKLIISPYKSEYYLLIGFSPKTDGLQSNGAKILFMTNNENKVEKYIAVSDWLKNCSHIIKENWKSKNKNINNPMMKAMQIGIIIDKTGAIKDIKQIRANEGKNSIGMFENIRAVFQYTKLPPLEIKYEKNFFPLGLMFEQNLNSFDCNMDNIALYSTKEIDWNAYMTKTEKRIKENWKPKMEYSANQVVVIFEIGKKGNLISNRIKISSNIKEADEAALKAVEAAAPFEKLPEQFKGESIPVEFSFGYNPIKQIYGYDKRLDGSFKDYMQAVKDHRKEKTKK